jgi:hypothetical protein
MNQFRISNPVKLRCDGNKIRESLRDAQYSQRGTTSPFVFESAARPKQSANDATYKGPCEAHQSVGNQGTTVRVPNVWI